MPSDPPSPLAGPALGNLAAPAAQAWPLRPLQAADAQDLIAIYGDAVLQQGAGRYSAEQLRTWAGHAAEGGAIARALELGHGLASLEGGDIAAFGVLEPLDRLSLLYCRSQSSRRGHASAILRALEQHAQAQGVQQLRTEASQLSRPLLLRRGWQVEAEETVRFAGVWFRRWRMIKPLQSASAQDSDG